MRTRLSIISFLFLSACSDNYKPVDTSQLMTKGFKKTQIILNDSLGNAILFLPTRYDTSFSWTNHSDCGKPCDKIEYRWQDKSLRITKESGFIWLAEPTDSVDRFTILHSGYIPFSEGTDSIVFKHHNYNKDALLHDPSTYRIKSDTIEKIGDRYFSIVVIDLYDSSRFIYSKKLVASTTIKNNFVDIKYELLTKASDSLTVNFIKNSILSLRSLRFSNGR